MKAEVKPITSGTGGVRPPRGRLTPIAIGGVIVFIIGLALVLMRPSDGKDVADVTSQPATQSAAGDSR